MDNSQFALFVVHIVGPFGITEIEYYMVKLSRIQLSMAATVGIDLAVEFG